MKDGGLEEEIYGLGVAKRRTGKTSEKGCSLTYRVQGKILILLALSTETREQNK